MDKFSIDPATLEKLVEKAVKESGVSKDDIKEEVSQSSKIADDYTKKHETKINSIIDNLTASLEDGQEADLDKIADEMPDLTPEVREHVRRTLKAAGPLVTGVFNTDATSPASIHVTQSGKVKIVRHTTIIRFVTGKLPGGYLVEEYKNHEGNMITVFSSSVIIKKNKVASRVTGMDLRGDVIFNDPQNKDLTITRLKR